MMYGYFLSFTRLCGGIKGEFNTKGLSASMQTAFLFGSIPVFGFPGFNK